MHSCSQVSKGNHKNVAVWSRLVSGRLLSAIKGTVSPYKRIVSNGSRMGIPIIQSSTWALWFCDVVITPLARAWPAVLALRPRSGVYFGIS